MVQLSRSLQFIFFANLASYFTNLPAAWSQTSHEAGVWQSTTEWFLLIIHRRKSFEKIIEKDKSLEDDKIWSKQKLIPGGRQQNLVFTTNEQQETRATRKKLTTEQCVHKWRTQAFARHKRNKLRPFSYNWMVEHCWKLHHLFEIWWKKKSQIIRFQTNDV